MRLLIKKFEPAFWALVIILILGCLGYEIYTHRDITPPDKNTPSCASIIYFNLNTKTLDTTYTSATVWGEDSLVNFTDQNGHIWWERDFISNEQRWDDDKIAFDDITLRDGEHFKVMYISMGHCQSKAIEDSLKDDLKSNDDDNDNN